jgi:replication initiator protein RepSA
VLDDIDEQLRALGVRGNADTGKGKRRARSTKRRQDAPDLPRRKVDPRTVGRAFTTPDGKVFRPSMGLTLTLGSYGPVLPDGTPADPPTYDYRAAARDAIHFPKLADRFWQNLRRVVGYDVQYFAAVEPQRRLAPHLHAAMRGTISRTELRQAVAATYHQVWWPPCDHAVYDDGHLPEWDPTREAWVAPDTGRPLPTWNEALDALDADPEAEPCGTATSCGPSSRPVRAARGR